MDHNFKPYVETSPIQTRTVKELVPGVYGRIQVQSMEEGFINLGLTARINNKAHFLAELSAQELRAAADVFKTLADYLEGKE